MFKTATKCGIVAITASILLAACAPSGEGDGAPSAASAPAAAPASVPAPATTAAAPAEASTAMDTPLPGDQAETARYKIDVSYPELGADEAPLRAALEEHTRRTKHEFMQGLPDPEQYPRFANRQLDLILHYTIASRVPRFVSVRGEGMLDGGGAHPMPLDVAFVYDTQSRKLVGIADLFSDRDAALKRLSDIARKALVEKLSALEPGPDEASATARAEWLASMQQMIDSGTEPDAWNFREFVVLAGADEDAAGLQLIFPPYQVAPYVYGTQVVDVPAMAFAELLTPAYQDVFRR